MKFKAFCNQQYNHQLRFILGEVSESFNDLQLCDERLQGSVESVLYGLYNKFKNHNSSREILLGGSTVEGAMLARFFKESGDKRVNEEVEVDFNIVVAELPVTHKYLVQDIDNKKGKVRIHNDEQFYQLIKNEVGFIIVVLR